MSASNAEQYANHLPDAIRRQSARVDQIVQEVYHPDQLAPAAPPASIEEPVSTTVVQDPQAQPAPQPAPQPDNWEQKYRTIQGKYDAEGAQHRSEAALLRNQVTSLERIVTAMQAERAATPAPQPAPVSTTVVPAELVEEYGQPLIDAVRTFVSPEIEALKAQNAKLLAQFDTLNNNQAHVTKEQAHQSVQVGLDNDAELGNTWRAVNNAPEFVNWLQLVDPISGQVRLALMRDAYDTGSTARVRAFFKAFTNEHTTPQVPATGTAHTGQEPAGQPSLENFAAPGRATGQAHVGAQPEKRRWNAKSVTAFYTDVRMGKYHGREADRLRIEQDLISASVEGRYQS